MKKRIIIVFSVVLILIGIFIAFYLISGFLVPKGKGALQVNSSIKADVFLNGKLIGKTDLCKCNQNETITEGEYSIKIVPDDKNYPAFTTKIKIQPGVLTAVERTFLPGSFASSYILTLEKTSSKDPQLLVLSIPDGALVSLDGIQLGVTPFLSKALTASEHEVEIIKQGFGKKTIRIRAVPSYKLVINAILGTDSGGKEELDDKDKNIKQSPTPTPTASPSAQIKIKDTPTGFLRVRKEGSVGAAEVGKVNPGEIYPFIDEVNGWFQIRLKDGTTGWVSSTYSVKITQ